MACTPQCTTDADCITTGCSGQVCAPQAVITTCQYEPQYVCYNDPTTSCGCNAGSCGWDQTTELDTCLSSFGR
jgi:eight-cysteine-cluster-containing protein